MWNADGLRAIHQVWLPQPVVAGLVAQFATLVNNVEEDDNGESEGVHVSRAGLHARPPRGRARAARPRPPSPRSSFRQGATGVNFRTKTLRLSPWWTTAISPFGATASAE